MGHAATPIAPHRGPRGRAKGAAWQPRAAARCSKRTIAARASVCAVAAAGARWHTAQPAVGRVHSTPAPPAQPTRLAAGMARRAKPGSACKAARAMRNLDLIPPQHPPHSPSARPIASVAPSSPPCGPAPAAPGRSGVRPCRAPPQKLRLSVLVRGAPRSAPAPAGPADGPAFCAPEDSPFPTSRRPAGLRLPQCRYSGRGWTQNLLRVSHGHRTLCCCPQICAAALKPAPLPTTTHAVIRKKNSEWVRIGT
jgi:hypothetical protein